MRQAIFRPPAGLCLPVSAVIHELDNLDNDLELSAALSILLPLSSAELALDGERRSIDAQVYAWKTTNTAIPDPICRLGNRRFAKGELE